MIRPEAAREGYIEKLLASASQALTSGSPRHALICDQPDILQIIKCKMEDSGWEIELLETETKEAPQYFGALIIRAPKIKTT